MTEQSDSLRERAADADMADEWREKINASADDGDGCAEMWATLSEERDDDD